MSAGKVTSPGRGFGDLSIAINGKGVPDEPITARVAGGWVDMEMPVSPDEVGTKKALQNLAKAANLALAEDFLETELEPAYEAARVRKGRVEILHRDYIGLGDGFFATLGRAAKSVQLTLQGPDPASPKGRKAIEAGHGGPIRGVFDLIGRKMNLIQEYEDKIPAFVEQMFDRLEAVRMIRGWDRNDWKIETTNVGLDIHITPNEVVETAAEQAKEAAKAEAKGKGSKGKEKTRKADKNRTAKKKDKRAKS
ncbi:MAG: hypothetical protein H6833_08860 [Planctomycetes bacterium]|nr:hypothetical protein [Planctomycetota bacterium]